MSVHIERSAEVFVEIAHDGLDGKVHGHSLAVRVFTDREVDLDIWKQLIENSAAVLNFTKLESSIQGRTFEDVGQFFLNTITDATAVRVRLPSMGHEVMLVKGEG